MDLPVLYICGNSVSKNVIRLPQMACFIDNLRPSLFMITKFYKKAPFLLLVTLSVLATTARAQDPGFSQFFASPLSLNPALTGKFNGVIRVAGNYRNQWPSINNAFITSTVSVDAPILVNKLPVNDTWGIGFL